MNLGWPRTTSELMKVEHVNASWGRLAGSAYGTRVNMDPGPKTGRSAARTGTEAKRADIEQAIASRLRASAARASASSTRLKV